ncbi:hypothetical protein E1281_36815 [Actinomadura sp. KC345]|uniref:hypothetical protein n=1 Tax=Actinomadura sp. KC345 TaxID=2530371 RepID=UPI0010497960|nr:hypothetical protein [Actinomadura sp. KC345]TDC41919.1 hypothetical protein E1281_36815 [Actinomadura sp. KC345]
MSVVTVVGVASMLWAMPERGAEGPQSTALVPSAKPSSPPLDGAAGHAPRKAPTSASPSVPETHRPTWKPPAVKAPDHVQMAAVELTSPGYGDLIDEDRDFPVAGTVRGLGDADLRIFIYAEERRRLYLADYGPEDINGDGGWSITSTGIGYEFGDDGDAYQVQVVRADNTCRKRLSGLDLGDDHYPEFSALPAGCQVRAQVRVIEGEE